MSIFKAYDIRGVYGKNLTEREAYFIGYYLARFKNLKKFKVAHDGRNSFETLTKFFIKGLIDSGSSVEYLGMISTPNFYFSLFDGIKDGVVITASHNSSEFNGFKIMLDLVSFDSRNGLYDLEKLVIADTLNIEDKYNNLKDELFVLSLNDLIENNPLIYRVESVTLNYIEFLRTIFNKTLNESEINILKNKSFGIDFSSGVSSVAGVDFFKNCGLKFNFYNDKVDGDFPIHSPDPLKAKDFLQDKKGDNFFVAAFDGDGDRICFYDSKSNQVLTDFVIAKYINFFNDFDGSKNFVCDLRVSKIIKQISDKKDLNVDFIRVGRAFYQTHMKEFNCKFGAELSGHLFFDEFNNLDNPDIALIYMLKISALTLLKNSNSIFDSFFDEFKIFHKLPEMNLKVKNTKLVFEKLKENFNDFIVSEIDGISFDFKNYWFNVRASNTEPVIRVNFEGNNLDIVNMEMNRLVNFIQNI